MSKPILSLDFDGVLHRYSKGWQSGALYDPITDGFFEWAEEAVKTFKLVVFSSRSKDIRNIDDMYEWYLSQLVKYEEATGRVVADEVRYMDFVQHKPTAFLTIDDRGLTFTGNWSDFPPAELIKFRPWNLRPKFEDGLMHHQV